MTAILEAIAAIIKWFLGDDQVAKRKQAEKDRGAQEAVDAVRNKDVDKVNEILNRNISIALIVAAMMMLSSCTTVRPVYIPENDKTFPITINGKPGWFVPELVFQKKMQELGGQ